MPKKIDEKFEINNNVVEYTTVYETKENLQDIEPTEPDDFSENDALSQKNKSLKNGKRYKYDVNKIKENKAVYTIRVKDKNKEVVLNFEQNDLEKGILKSAKKRVKKLFGNKSRVLSGVFVLINIMILLGIMLYQQNTYGVVSINDLVNSSVNYTFLFVCILAFVVMMIFEGLRNYVLIKRSAKVSMPIISLKTSIIERYYDQIVPFSGGKPFAIFYLHSKNIKTSVATSVPIAKMVFYSIATVLLSSIVVMLKWVILNETSTLFLVLGIVLFIANFILIFGVLFLSISKKIAPRFIYRLVKWLYKIGLIDNYEQAFYNVMRFLLEYQKSVQYYLKSKSVTILSLIGATAVSFLIAIMPFLIYSIFATPSWEIMLEMLFTYYILIMATKLIPIPGGVGVADITFASIFSPYFTGGVLVWALILWRIFSYFLYIIQGVVLLLWDFIFADKKQKAKIRKELKLEV